MRRRLLPLLALAAAAPAAADPPLAGQVGKLPLGEGGGGFAKQVDPDVLQKVVPGNTITFQVPVQLDEAILPADKTFAVSCVVKDGDGHVLGSAVKKLGVSSGAYDGTASVPVQADEGAALGEAASYTCRLGIRPVEGDGGWWNVGPEMGAVWARPKDGTPFVSEVAGSVP